MCQREPVSGGARRPGHSSSARSTSSCCSARFARSGRARGPTWRAWSGLSKPTVSLALANVERSGLVRIAGQRTGVPGRSARLYEIRPDAGFVLGLDIGHHYLRGALADLAGEVRAKHSTRTRAASVRGRLADLIHLSDTLCEEAGVARSSSRRPLSAARAFTIRGATPWR